MAGVDRKVRRSCDAVDMLDRLAKVVLQLQSMFLDRFILETFIDASVSLSMLFQLACVKK